MVLWALHLPPETLEPYLDACATERERDTVARLLEARCLGCPLPYLTGEAWLGGLRFLCDPRALVPRSPIVEVLDGSLAEWMTISPPPDHWPRTIVDLCTGGGSLAIHAALRYPEACVHALDIDTRALSLCRENVALHGLEDRVVLGEGDLLAPLPPDLRIDLLVCNPPYVPAESMSRLPAEYRAEPGHALAGGDDGMDVIRRLLPQAAGRLTRHGVLVLEVGHEAETFERTFPMLEISWLETAAHDRMVALLTADGLRAAFQDAARA